jgi:mRNA interferase MazF
LDSSYLRGQVWEAEVPNLGRKPFLILSNNGRNRALSDVLAVRVTTAPKPDLPTIVELEHQDQPVVGRVLCDDLSGVPKSWFKRYMGPVSRGTLQRVENGVRVALGLI